MRAYRLYVGRPVLVRTADVTYRASLRSARGGALVLGEVTAVDHGRETPVDGVVLVPFERVLHVQVPS